jgi:baculoviral IAP repeat-containing protein 6 (apollon)
MHFFSLSSFAMYYRLEVIEDAAIKAEEEAAAAGAANAIDAIAQRQIFNPKAAFRRLVRELEDIFKSRDLTLQAEAVGPAGLFEWHVSVAGFDPGSPLASDLQAAGRCYGSSTVQMRISFRRGLQPFYPPAVRIISPRFYEPILSAVACHPMFDTDNWDFTLGAKDVILRVKSFLQAYARVDLESPRNRDPHGAYLAAEHLLVRLQALTNTDPIDAGADPRHAYPEVFDRRQATAACPSAPAEKKARSDPSSEGLTASTIRTVWSSGVGYGTDNENKKGPVWDVRRAEAVQAARDGEVGEVLSALATEIRKGLGAEGNNGDGTALLRVLRGSCLAPLLRKELSCAGLQDMFRRCSYYRELVDCVAAVAAPETADMLTWHEDGSMSKSSIATAMTSLNDQAAHFLRILRNTTDIAGGANGKAIASASTSTSTSGRVSNAVDTEDAEQVALANVVQSVAKVVMALASQVVPSPGSEGIRTRHQAATLVSTGGLPEGNEARYASVMEPFKVRILAGVAENHSFNSEAMREPTTPSRLRARRLASELASMQSSLSVTASSSIFLVVDEQINTLCKVLITGPESTPYDSGVFIFDLYLPPSYPECPPKVKLRTTGGGRVRFNPNLYDTGKVCLSLLGTWSGNKGETWNEHHSTILQVLVSIQALILVPNPYYNEPGFEQHTDEASSNAYNANIMEQTVRWGMLDQLSAPPPYFADVINAHFKERSKAVLSTVKRFVDWCENLGHSLHAGAMRDMVPRLEAKLAELSIK